MTGRPTTPTSTTRATARRTSATGSRFKTKVRNRESFLYAGPGTTSYDKLNVIQTYSIRRESIKWVKKARRSGKKERKRYVAKKSNYRYVAKNLPVAPPNIGPKTFPNYQAFVNGAIKNLKGGGKVFAGPRDDPFFVDLGGTFDAINIRQLTGNQGQGKDDLSGFSVSSTVLLVPESAVTRDGKPVKSAAASNSVIGVWSTTERKRAAGHQRRLRPGRPAQEGRPERASRSRAWATRW